MMKFPLLFQSPPREGDGGGAGAGSPPASGSAPGSAPSGAPAGGGIASPPPAVSGDWQMPDGFPDRLKATSQDEFFGKLQEDWKKQHQTLSGLPAAPKSVDDYRVTLGEKTAAAIGDLEKDPGFAIAKKAALAAGISADAFGKLVPTFYDGLVEAGLVAKPVSLVSEAAKFLGRDAPFADEQAAAQAIGPLFETIQRGVDKIAEDAKLGPESKAALYALMDTADGLRAAQAIVKALGGDKGGPQPGGAGGGATGVTRTQLQERVKDPRNQVFSSKYDANFAAETRRLYEQLGPGA